MEQIDYNRSRLKKFTADEKIALCDAWEASGLSKSEFARQNGISISHFCGWFPKSEKAQQNAARKKAIKKDWISISNAKTLQKDDLIPIEIKLTTGIVMTLSMSLEQIISLTQGVLPCN